MYHTADVTVEVARLVVLHQPSLALSNELRQGERREGRGGEGRWGGGRGEGEGGGREGGGAQLCEMCRLTVYAMVF